ncbi:hypothetical protein Glove_209g108 [Diversispora epigaea]|uniref:Uncharacterized protein n=1 Tax=Diversispora epigaea TaxID=1348612 RepID=A0A397IIM5_9GLOM|nr:hypothetical protein Glove_209g108 [Diversispora epigaea]
MVNDRIKKQKKFKEARERYYANECNEECEETLKMKSIRLGERKSKRLQWLEFNKFIHFVLRLASECSEAKTTRKVE